MSSLNLKKPTTCTSLLKGQVRVSCGKPEVPVGVIEKGETLGEFSLISSSPHSVTATTETKVETAMLTHHDLSELIRRRQDIGVIIYRNLGIGLGKKLLCSDHSLCEQRLGESTSLNPTYPFVSREQ